jgi:hypothetical protein
MDERSFVKAKGPDQHSGTFLTRRHRILSQDLKDLEVGDMQEAGMKPIEIKRLQRHLGQA